MSQAEQPLTAAMATARAGRTTVVIAHRPSTIRTADRLVVFDRGRVVEHGTHADLLAAGGIYANLIAFSAHVHGQRVEL